MTELKHEAILLVKQMPEDQIPYIIQYMQNLKDRSIKANPLFDASATMSPKQKAFLELEGMLKPVYPEFDYDKELSEARDEKYGYFD